MFMTIFEEMLNYDLRVKDMDKAKVDMAVVSLTCPNVYWGDAEVSASTAKMMNDGMAFQQSRHPDRLRFFCSLPWQYPDLAVEELERAVGLGAAGVMVIANVDEKHLTDPCFASIWAAIDRHALPVIIHPSLPPGSDVLKLDEFHLAASNGFIIDTTLAISRMIMDGFFNSFPNLRIISCHGGGAIP
jgi:aminocarboxymuconate-semialdehyde decarboxylase